jgi:hypothetical protein
VRALPGTVVPIPTLLVIENTLRFAVNPFAETKVEFAVKTPLATIPFLALKAISVISLFPIREILFTI